SPSEEGGIIVTVDDEGPGLSEEARARLFEPFFTTKSSGTGLGLTITRQIVETHGGQIGCEAREPRGTRMWVKLPGTADRAVTSSEGQRHAPGQGNGVPHIA